MNPSEFFQKIFSRLKSKSSGQAVLEYLLVLFVTVAIILGLLYQFNSGFKVFLDNFFGDYIACLLETGELPSLGAQGPGPKECSPPQFSFNAESSTGTSPGDSGSGGPSGPSAQGSSNGGSQGKGGSNSPSSTASRPPATSRPLLNISRGTPNAERGFNRSNLRPSRQTLKTKTEDSNSDFSTLSGRTIIRKRRFISKGFINPSFHGKNEKARIMQSASPKSPVTLLRKPVFVIQNPKGRLPSSTGEKTGFSWQMYLKFIIIAIIFIIILIFMGRQALSIKKSWEKSE